MTRYAPWLALAALVGALSVARADHPSLSYGLSYLTTNQIEARADGQDEVLVTLVLVKHDGRPLAGVPLTDIRFRVEGPGTIQRVIGPSSSYGQVYAVLTSRQKGTCRVHAEVAGRDVLDSARFEFDYPWNA